MRAKFARLICLVAVLGLTVSAIAQEGHPLSGTWYGEFGPSKDKRYDLTVILNWDGKAASGMINPGPSPIQIKTATLDSSKWMVHFEADAKNKAGGMDHFVFDGKMADVVSYNRTITGTWTCGATKGDFRIQRD
jgi:hypothetical protein